MFDRYSMSFVGGLLGGGAFSITPDLKMVYKGIQSMSREDAIREIAAMHRNGDIEPLLKQLYSTNIGNKYLSFDRTKDENGELIFAQAGNGND
jgi:hypothetical protein